MRNRHAFGSGRGDKGVHVTQVLTERATLSAGSIMIYKDYGHRVRLAYDPKRLTEAGALALLYARIPRLATEPTRVIHHAHT